MPLRVRTLPGADDPLWARFIELYRSVFPEPQRETEAAILANLDSGRDPEGRGNLMLAAVDAQDACVGGLLYHDLRSVRCAYVSYLFVDAAHRNEGIGSCLLRQMRRALVQGTASRGRRPIGVFVEIDLESCRKRRREQFWARQGIVPLDVAWSYPPLRGGRSPIPARLAYGAYPRGKSAWYPNELMDVAGAIFRSAYAYLPQATRTLAVIVRDLRRLPADVPVRFVRPFS